MINEKVLILQATAAITVSGLAITAKKLQWQIQPIHLPDIVVRTVEIVAQGVKYTVYGIVGVVVLAGLFFYIRHALRTWTKWQWISMFGYVMGVGLFFWGISTLTIPLIVAGTLSMWVMTSAALMAPREN